MKKKELKKLAGEIAKWELVISDKTSSPTDIYIAKEQIINLGNKIGSLEDIMILDELIQEKIKEIKQSS